jgi:formamidopyrimidine-DNA glycosylase
LPELPDVEVFRRYVDSTSLHSGIRDVEVRDDRILDDIKESDLRDLIGKQFDETMRIGKHLFLKTGNRWLVFHFGMTGFVKYYKNDEPDHVKVRFGLINSYNLVYICTRMFGKVTLIEVIDEYISENDIGPDILGIDKDGFVSRLKSKRGSIKSALMDQSLMSGLGNIYTDEVLFHAGYHPMSSCENFKDGDLSDLHRTIVKVLETAIEAGADPDELPDDYLIPLRGKNAVCPLDGTVIEKIKLNGRSTYFCPGHQETL